VRRLGEVSGALVTAFRTLTILPVPGKEVSSPASSLPWFPVVGLTLGGLVYAVAMVVDLAASHTWPEVVAFAALAAGVFLTRGLHLDGLSDWADGFGSLADREQMLEIMKDPRAGVFGVTALILSCLGKWVVLVRLWQLRAGLWILAAFVVSRTMQAELAAAFPYARREGGTARAFVEGTKPGHRVGSLVAAALILYALFALKGLGALALGVLTGELFGLWCMKRLGGVTGDILGACSEFVEFAVLLAGVFLW